MRSLNRLPDAVVVDVANRIAEAHPAFAACPLVAIMAFARAMEVATIECMTTLADGTSVAKVLDDAGFRWDSRGMMTGDAGAVRKLYEWLTNRGQ